MNLNQIKYFVSAAENSSFTKAAAQHYISQTAVTQQIQALEDFLGVPLFNRTTRPISLTAAGETFLGEAKDILTKINHSINAVQEASTGFVGNLKIGYTKGYERSSLSHMLQKFHSQYPKVLVSCYRCDTDTLASGLVNKDFDVIFTWDSTELSKDAYITSRLIERSPLLVAMSCSHPLASRKSLSRIELKNENILYMTHSRSGDSAGDRHFYDLYYKAGYKPNIVFRSNDMESVLMMVTAEEGISIMPSYVASGDYTSSNLKFVPLTGENEHVDILAMWSTEEKNPVLQRFTGFITE